MSDPTYCPSCGAQRNVDEYTCRHCQHVHDDNSQVAFEHAYAGATVQAQMFSTVMQGLLGVHSVALMEQFWNNLDEPSRKRFAQKLAERFFLMLNQGACDDAIVRYVRVSDMGDSWLYDEEGQLAPAVRRAYAVRAGRIIAGREKPTNFSNARHGDWESTEKLKFERELVKELGDGAKQAVRKVGEQMFAAHREQLASMVRDRLPDLESLAEETIREMTREAIADVKSKVSRERDGD